MTPDLPSIITPEILDFLRAYMCEKDFLLPEKPYRTLAKEKGLDGEIMVASMSAIGAHLFDWSVKPEWYPPEKIVWPFDGVDLKELNRLLFNLMAKVQELPQGMAPQDLERND